MKTILFLENGVYGGGSFESLFLLVTHLDKMLFRPVVVFANRTIFYDRLKERGIAVVLLNDSLYSRGKKRMVKRIFVKLLLIAKQLFPWGALTIEGILHRDSIRALCDLVKKYNVHLIHLNNQSVRDLYGVIAARQMKIPCVSYLRSARTSYLPHAVAHFLNDNVAQFIANSNFAKTYWQGLGIDSAKITVVYNAIENMPAAVLNVRTEWGIDPAVKYVIGCVGNLTEGKGQEFLMRVFKRLRDRQPYVAFLIVGDGPTRTSLEQLAQRLNIKDAVIFTGYDTRAKEIIAGLDVVALPSKTETFGRTLLEAMVVGTPVVATRIGGIPEVVAHGVNGLLVEYGDEKALAYAIMEILTNKALRSHLIAQGKRVVLERFNVEAHVSALSKFYDEICGARIATGAPKIYS